MNDREYSMVNIVHNFNNFDNRYCSKNIYLIEFYEDNYVNKNFDLILNLLYFP